MMSEEDPGLLGETIFRLEVGFKKLIDHPSPGVRHKARDGLKRLEAMKQGIQDDLQRQADIQAEDDTD